MHRMDVENYSFELTSFKTGYVYQETLKHVQTLKCNEHLKLR